MIDLPHYAKFEQQLINSPLMQRQRLKKYSIKMCKKNVENKEL